MFYKSFAWKRRKKKKKKVSTWFMSLCWFSSALCHIILLMLIKFFSWFMGLTYKLSKRSWCDSNSRDCQTLLLHYRLRLTQIMLNEIKKLKYWRRLSFLRRLDLVVSVVDFDMLLSSWCYVCVWFDWLKQDWMCLCVWFDWFIRVSLVAKILVDFRVWFD